MDGLVFRNDDINPSTDFVDLYRKYDVIKKKFPDSQIMSAVSLFGRSNNYGSVYSEVPFKEKPLPWFYDVDAFLGSLQNIYGNIASHGLFHVDHTKISKDAQEMSILSSCHLLKTKKFVPPFNRWNKETLLICSENNIQLVRIEEGWKSLDFQPYDNSTNLWYFHSWKFTVKDFERTLNGHSLNLGQL